jgi:Na+/proline symporter
MNLYYKRISTLVLLLGTFYIPFKYYGALEIFVSPTDMGYFPNYFLLEFVLLPLFVGFISLFITKEHQTIRFFIAVLITFVVIYSAKIPRPVRAWMKRVTVSSLPYPRYNTRHGNVTPHLPPYRTLSLSL